MSAARETIFARLEAAGPPQAPPPQRVRPPAMPPDPWATLQSRIEQAGGRLERASAEGWSSQIAWPLELSTIEHLYLGDGVLADGVSAADAPPLAARGVGIDPRSVQDLAALEVCVLRAEFAVVENGAAWQLPASPLERAAALLAEHLIVLVPEAALVATLHQAYQRIDLGEARFGWFLCGPSKTADIEQALVLGAHGPRTMSLVLLGD